MAPAISQVREHHFPSSLSCSGSRSMFHHCHCVGSAHRELRSLAKSWWPWRWGSSDGPGGDMRQCCILVAVKANHRLPVPQRGQEESDDLPSTGIQKATSRPQHLSLSVQMGSGNKPGWWEWEESLLGSSYFCLHPPRKGWERMSSSLMHTVIGSATKQLSLCLISLGTAFQILALDVLSRQAP